MRDLGLPGRRLYRRGLRRRWTGVDRHEVEEGGRPPVRDSCIANLSASRPWVQGRMVVFGLCFT